MSAPLFLDRNHHRTWLKWHRARRRASDPVFTGSRILEGMRLGASLEIDLVLHADNGFAVLHDRVLDRETTGTGAVAATSAETLRGLYLRDNDREPTTEPVMLLEDLVALLSQGGIHPDALLQLDMKEDGTTLNAAAYASFRSSIAPAARHMILSTGDADAIKQLSDGVEGLRIGFDPCGGELLRQLRATGDFSAFAAGALAALPQAELIYLETKLVIEADRQGFDLIAAIHAAGRRIDAYTIRDPAPANLAIVERLLALRADQITTDDAEGLVEALKASAG